MTAPRGKETSPGENFLIPLSCPTLFVFLCGRPLQSTKKSLCVCIPGNSAASRQVYHLVCALQMCKCFKTPEPAAATVCSGSPLQGVLRKPLQCLSFSLCKHVEQAAVERSSHPFRQKYLLLKCWVCTRLNLFKEFAIIETYVRGFFPPGVESDLLKTAPFFS